MKQAQFFLPNKLLMQFHEEKWHMLGNNLTLLL